MRQKVNRRIFRGFTLIELLIVVLIIGIFAAIAVPQYQKAVLKSRFSSLVPLGKALNEGNEAYYLEHGSYTDNVGNLDVTTQNNQAEVTLGNEPQHQYVKLTRSDIHNNLVMYQKHSTNFPGEIHCEAVEDNTQANWLCEESLKGEYVGTRGGYKTYSLDPSPNGVLARMYNGERGIMLVDGDSCTNCVAVTATGENTKCVATGQFQCDGSSFSNGASCVGDMKHSCRGTHFSEGATCYGNKGSACGFYSRRSSYDASYCIGLAGSSCRGGQFTNYSKCTGYANFACGGARFTNHSVCEAKVLGACDKLTGYPATSYDDTSYCAGDYCPDGAPSSDSTKVWYRGEGTDWPDTRESILVDKPTESE